MRHCVLDLSLGRFRHQRGTPSIIVDLSLLLEALISFLNSVVGTR